MRRKKQELARRPDRILPSSLLHPMPLPTYVPSTLLTLVAFRCLISTSQLLLLIIQAHLQLIMILLPLTRRLCVTWHLSDRLSVFFSVTADRILMQILPKMY